MESRPLHDPSTRIMLHHRPTATNPARRTVLLAVVGLLLVLLLPASAHLGPEGSASSALFTATQGVDTCRWEGNQEVCAGTDGVSGSYVNYPENAYLYSPTVFAGNGGYFPRAVISFAWCDLEVQGDGSDQTVDEGRVDDEPTPGLMMDGTWDDGGIGGACHTNDQYSTPGYNTAGCDGIAYAEDSVSGGAVWIGAACDETTSGGAVGLELCLFNELVSDPQTSGINQCIANAIDGGLSESAIACGSDGIMDDIRYGTGEMGIDYPVVDAPCVSSDALAAVFTYNYINEPTIECYLPNPDCSPVLIPATMGWIDTR